MAENPFQIMGEVLPVVKSMIWASDSNNNNKTKAEFGAPVFLYEQQDELVPYVISTDSSEDNISMLDDDMTFLQNGTRDVSSCFRPRPARSLRQPQGRGATPMVTIPPPPVVVASGARKPYRRQHSEPATSIIPPPPPVVVARGARKPYRRQHSEPVERNQARATVSIRHSSKVADYDDDDDEHDEWDEFVLDRFQNV